MSEYMGMIYGKYDAKADGFVAGGSSLHSCMMAHGPDATTFLKASQTSVPQTPVYFNEGLAFMFESCYMLKVSSRMLQSPTRQLRYTDCWRNLPKLFTGHLHVDIPLPPPANSTNSKAAGDAVPPK